MEQVASQAGFSKRTVYLYFKNKDELFITVAEQGLVILRERLEAVGVDDLSVQEGIRSILDTYLWFAREHPSYFRIIFQEPTPQMMANISEKLRRRVEEHEQACLGVVVRVTQKALAQGLISEADPMEIAGIFWGAVTGIVQLSMGGSQSVFTRRTREQLSQKAVWLLFEGMLKNGGGQGGGRAKKNAIRRGRLKP